MCSTNNYSVCSVLPAGVLRCVMINVGFTSDCILFYTEYL